jgi:hypothetical protein
MRLRERLASKREPSARSNANDIFEPGSPVRILLRMRE